MEESILNSTKKVLGLSEGYTAFDLDIITHINLAFSIVNDLGVGPTGGFYIEDKTSLWSDFVASPTQLATLRTYVFLKVRMLFDPPATSFAIEMMTKQVEEYEWRMSTRREVEIAK
jgi:hypothetical protein